MKRGRQPGSARDLRSYAQQTTTRLIIGALLLLFLVGSGLIYVFYGPNAALMGLVCLLGAMLPVAAIWLLLMLLEWGLKRGRRE
jgi:hypothetical protein